MADLEMWMGRAARKVLLGLEIMTEPKRISEQE
jgi:hypothetical protein